MLEQYVHALAGTLAPSLLVVGCSVLLTVGEGKNRPRSKYWRLYGLGIGVLTAIVFALLRTTAVLDRRSTLNLPLLVLCILTDVLMLVIVARAQRTTTHWQQHPMQLHIANTIAALNIAATTLYALPDVILQLTRVVEPGDSPFTSEMLIRSLGFVLGIATAVLTAVTVYTLRTVQIRRWFTIAAWCVVAINVVLHFTELIVLLMNMLILRLHGAPFRALISVHNATIPLTLAQLVVFVLPILASLVLGFKAKAPSQANQAQVRQTSALRRHAISSALWVCVALITVSIALTVGVAQTRKVPTLSEPEEYALQADTATITFEQVADGHLHRFAYKAKDGTAMRFIVIKKNGGAYGVALDACETCGDAGYYEKDGKIICKRCDVAINLATIGFKGGCNPIPVPYTVGGGHITIHTADLDALSSHFK